MHEISAHADVDALAPAMMISGASDVLPLISAVDAASIPSTSAMPDPTTKITKTAVTPQQTSVQRDISDAQEQLLALVHLRDAGLITKELEKKMKSVELNLKQKKMKLKRLQQEATRQHERRLKIKRTLEDIVEEQPNLRPKLRQFTRDTRGRPAITDDSPDLLEAIIDIASIGAAASDRRRSQEMRSCKTLDDLHKTLSKQGYHLSRSGTYLRLLPRRSSSMEGKRHIKTVHVKLIRAANTAHDRHKDAAFAFASMSYLDEICSMFGEDVCFYLSQDDKAKVPLGIPAATKQAPILMHLEYAVRLPDHDFAVASRHKLIPSVYAACVVTPGKLVDAVTYSGPTYIAVRSMKHGSSTAFTHGHDMERLRSIPSFQPLMCTADGCVKPIVVVASDGGPDENPRFAKPLQVAAARFIDWDLDVYLSGTHAPHYSAYNRVERRMAPLSRELAGLVLPHDHYGSHLNASGKTIDTELEKKNFEQAGKTLAEVWSAVVLDKHDVYAEYIDPVEREPPSEPEVNWVARHVRQSQYFLQIIKCDDSGCCRPWRTSWKNYFPDRFLPGPVVLTHSTAGLSIPEPESVKDQTHVYYTSLAQRLAFGSKIPFNASFDMHCPSLAQSEIIKRTCPVCGVYHSSQASVRRHQSVHTTESTDTENLNQNLDDDVSEAVDIETAAQHSAANAVMIQPDVKLVAEIPVIRNLFEWVQSAFV